MSVIKKWFGKSSQGRDIYKYILTNEKGMQVVVSDLGATLIGLMVPDKNGELADVVLGHDSTEEYYENKGFLGALV